MARLLNHREERTNYDNLIHSLYPPVEAFSVTLRAGQGALPRGTALAVSGGELGTQEFVIMGTEAKATPGGDGEDPQAETLTANCVLAEPVDTGEDKEDSGDEVYGIAYRTGHFNQGSLITKDDYIITHADKEAFRQAGILLSDAWG